MIRRLKAAFLYARFAPYVAEPQWVHGDAKELQKFMQSETGQKLAAYLRNYVLRSQANAVISQSNRDYECGLSAGCGITVARLDSLANPEHFPAQEEGSPAPETNQED